MAGGQGVGAENSVTSCDLRILVCEAAEPISPQRSDDRSEGRGVRPVRGLIERSVRAVGVVVLEVGWRRRR